MAPGGRPPYSDILTPREWEVLALVREGLTNPQIAERLGISAAGARYHVSEILSKLGVHSRKEAAAWGEPKRMFSRLSIFAPLRPTTAKLIKVGLGSAGVASTVGLVMLFLMALNSRTDDATIGPLGKLAYIQNGDVWVKALPNGAPKRLTKDGHNAFPSWSVSGDWILYLHNRHDTSQSGGPGVPNIQIWVMKADGTGRRRIDSPGIWASWVPATDRLVYSGVSGSLVTEDADGGNRRQLPVRPYSSATETGTIAGLLWSHDSNWFAYVDERWPAGSPKPEPGNPRDGAWTYVGLWAIRADGTGAKELLNLGPAPREEIIPAEWSADDNNVLFSVLAMDADPQAMQDGLPLREVPINVGPSRDLGVTSLVMSPDLSPSSDRSGLAIVVGGLQETWTNKRIAVLSSVNSTLRELTGGGIAAISPAWSPDGSQIAYVASIDAGPTGRDASLASRRIWVMAADGTRMRQLTADEGYRDEHPQWSADGTRILFARLSTEPCDSSRYSLWLLDLQDGSLNQVAAGLPLFSTRNERLVVGQVPKCYTQSDDGWITDLLGSLSLAPVLDWWQPAN